MYSRASIAWRLRRPFLLMAGALAVFAIAYSWVVWQRTRDDESRHMGVVAELAERSLNAYFSQLEAAFQLATIDIVGPSGEINERQARLRLVQVRAAHPDLLTVSIANPEGVMLLSSSIDTHVPVKVGDVPAFQEALNQLRSERRLNIGKPVFGPISMQWVIPLRYAIRDHAGNVAYVLLCGLTLARPQSFWRDARLPPGMALGIMRDDGFLIGRHPNPPQHDEKAIYGAARSGGLIQHLRASNYPSAGRIEGPSSLEGLIHVTEFRRLRNFPLTFFVTQPIHKLREIWWRSVQLPYLLMLALLAGGVLVYRRTLAQQLAFEVERQAVENTRHAASGQGDAILAALGDALVITDAQQRIVLVNARAEQLFGYRGAELIGESLASLMPAGRGLLHGEHMARFDRNGGAARIMGAGRNIVAVRSGGEHFPVELSIARLELAAGTLFISVVRDATERKQTEAALRLAGQQAEHTNAARSQWLAGMSSALRAPLERLLGAAAALDGLVPPADGKAAAGAILSAGQALQRQIEMMIELSALAAGQLALVLEEIDAAVFLSECRDLASAQAANRGMTLDLDPAHARGLKVRADRVRLRQALRCYLSNAIEHRSDPDDRNRPGSVRLELNAAANASGAARVRYTVTKAGPDLTAAQRESLFLVFAPPHGRVPDYAGPGMGLAIARRLIEAMQGTFGVDSMPGSGYRIWLELPAA